ncbi:MAG TPA: BON domain-containing protein [Solirubrobacteraceae bacterium]|nr:BON domain-containing protein [Solirubrobacteraceae bacterium]
MSYNTTVEDDIRAALRSDPRITSPDEVAVSAVDGDVVLRGTVGNFSQRRAAAEDARKAAGVDDLDDQLQVRILDDERRADADIRGIALQILAWDNEVPEDLVDVKVSDGWVTLTGETSYQFESDAAYYDVANLAGVTGVTNEIQVITP